MSYSETNAIKAPLVKSCTAITAAAGANSGVASELKTDLIVQASTGNIPDMLIPLLSLPWGHIASMCAALYTSALLLEWVWKKPLRWVLVKAGLRQDVKRLTHDEWRESLKDD